MRKNFILKLFFCLVLFFISFNVYALDKYDKIDDILNDYNYFYLPSEAKEYIKNAYNITGEIILTERNKEEGKPYLNPKYISYLTLSEEEKNNIGNIPDAFIVDYISPGRLRASFPTTYDLRNVGGNSYITPLKNQGSLGICWAMTTAEQAESFLMLQNNTPYNSSSLILSPRQLDYATSTDGIKNYTNENGVRVLGEGGNYQMSYFTLANGVSLVPELVMQFNQSYAKKELYQVLNYGNSKYEVEQTAAMPKLSSGYTSDQFNSYLDQIKSRIMTYGGAFVGTGSPQGSCGSKNIDGKYVVVDNTDCNTDTNYGSHAMHIIGWDDNYNYSYCSSGTTHYNVTSTGTCSTGTLKSGTGAWLVRNSWGEDANYSYIYLSYDSTQVDIGFITSLSSMESRNWDNNYHKMPWGSDGSSYYSIVDSASFTKNMDGEEILKKIKFTSLAQNGSFNISVNNGSQTYSNVATVQTPYPGVYTVDLSSSNISLNSSSFSVTVLSSNFSSMLMGSISAFTSNVPTYAMIKTDDITVDLTSNINKVFPVYSTTKNIPSNERVTYKIYNGSIDVTSHFSVMNNIVAENNILAYINAIDYVPSGDYRLETKYGGRTYSSTISITSADRQVTVTLPDNTTVTYNYGDTYNLGTNNTPKDPINIAEVTFVYQDDVTSDSVDYVKEIYTPAGWLVNGVLKSNNEIITLTDDITIAYNYNSSYQSPEFASPSRNHYTFDGWFDEDDNLVESYTGDEDITLFAHWTLNKPSNFTIDSDNLSLTVGDTHQVEATFIPDGTDDTLTFSGYDDEIISITPEGLITALSTGETDVTISLDSNNEITKTISIVVLSNEIESTVLDVETKSINRIIIGEEPNTEIEDFLLKMNNPIEYLQVYNEDDELINDTTTRLGTGMKLKLVIDDVIRDEVIIVVRGDANGDGLANTRDLGPLEYHILEDEENDTITGVYIYAMDFNGDEIANTQDEGILIKFLLEDENISSLNSEDLLINP